MLKTKFNSIRQLFQEEVTEESPMNDLEAVTEEIKEAELAEEVPASADLLQTDP